MLSDVVSIVTLGVPPTPSEGTSTVKAHKQLVSEMYYKTTII